MSHPALHRGREPARVLEVGTQPGIDAGMSRNLAAPGPHDGWLAAGEDRHVTDGVHGIAADVHETTASDVRIPAEVARRRRRHEHACLDADQLADLAVAGQLQHAVHEGVVAVVEGLHAVHARGRRGVSHHASLGRIARVGLLAQDVLARSDGPEVPRPVQAVGQRVVDHLDVRVVDDVLVGGVHPLDAVLLGEGRSTLGVARGDGHQSRAGQPGGLDDGDVADAGSAEEAEPQGLHRVSPCRGRRPR